MESLTIDIVMFVREEAPIRKRARRPTPVYVNLSIANSADRTRRDMISCYGVGTPDNRLVPKALVSPALSAKRSVASHHAVLV